MHTLLFVLCLAVGVRAPDQTIPGQKQFIVIGDSFRFVEGSWASYTIFEKATHHEYTMRLAILERLVKKGKPLRWMEIAVDMPDQPAVVTRMLVEETFQGPGELTEVIVQVAGYSPFRVPKKYYRDPTNRGVGQVQRAVTKSRLDKCTVGCGGQMASAWQLEAEATDGTALKAVVSEEVPPIGVCFAENADITMGLTARGSDAKTAIHGSPRSFTLWILEQLAEGLTKHEN